MPIVVTAISATNRALSIVCVRSADCTFFVIGSAVMHWPSQVRGVVDGHQAASATRLLISKQWGLRLGYIKTGVKQRMGMASEA